MTNPKKYPDISKLAGYRQRNVPSYSKSSLTWEFSNFLIEYAKRNRIALPSSSEHHNLSMFLFTEANEGFLIWSDLRRDCGKAMDWGGYSGERVPHYFARDYVLSPEEADEYHILIERNIQKYLLYFVQEGKCTQCSRKIPFADITRDHKKPKSRGGTDSYENLQLMCQSCNEAKGDSWCLSEESQGDRSAKPSPSVASEGEGGEK